MFAWQPCNSLRRTWDTGLAGACHLERCIEVPYEQACLQPQRSSVAALHDNPDPEGIVRWDDRK